MRGGASGSADNTLAAATWNSGSAVASDGPSSPLCTRQYSALKMSHDPLFISTAQAAHYCTPYLRRGGRDLEGRNAAQN